FKEDLSIQPDARTGAVPDDDEQEHYRPDPQSDCALELALRIKKETGNAAVKAVTLGPPRAERVLRRALAAGADSAVRVWDAAFDCGDPLLPARVLGAAVRAMGCDIVLCGDASADAGNSFTGAAVAAALKAAYLPRIRELDVETGAVRVRCRQKNRLLTYRCELPAVFTLGQGRPCPPAPPKRIMWANREKIPVLDARDLSLTDIENMKSGVLVEKLTYPKPRDKRGLGMPPDLSPLERFARLLYGGISLKSDQTIVTGSSPDEAAKLFDWLVREKMISK
ncbi:MAG: hypothetical protein ABIH04_02195, partial [Planctomycetota bacterium]